MAICMMSALFDLGDTPDFKASHQSNMCHIQSHANVSADRRFLVVIDHSKGMGCGLIGRPHPYYIFVNQSYTLQEQNNEIWAILGR